MKRFCLNVAVGFASVMAVGQQAGYQGLYTGPVDRSVNAIEGTLGRYLNGDELKSVLTPGEFANWDLKLNAGDVLVADAHSDAFDPGLQIVDGQSKVLAENDDRYPGDQRPLLFWRCEKAGTYGLRVRCFRDGRPMPGPPVRVAAVERGTEWLCAAVERGIWREPSRSSRRHHAAVSSPTWNFSPKRR